MLACTGLFEPRGSRLELLKSALNAREFHVQIVLVYLHTYCITVHSYNERCSQKLQKKITKNPFWGVQGYLRSWMLINLKSPSVVLVMISSMYVPICNRFHVT